MRPRPHETGQALILIVFAAVGLFAFTALAIDGSRAFSDRRHAQNAADTAVLAAALAKVRGQDYVMAATERAASNGYATDADSTVEVHLCNEPGVTCQGLPTGADPAQFIQVRIFSEIPTTFGRIIGRETLQSAAEAVARVQGSTSTSTFPDDAIIALRKNNCGICSGGDLELYVNGSGIFSNSTDSCNPPQHGSMDFDDGKGIINSQGGFTMPPGAAICVKPPPFGQVTGTPQSGQQISSLPFSIPSPTIACSADVYDASAAVPDGTGALVYPPGTYPAKLTLDSTQLHKFVGN